MRANGSAASASSLCSWLCSSLGKLFRRLPRVLRNCFCSDYGVEEDNLFATPYVF